jgi:hypothetical protein
VNQVWAEAVELEVREVAEAAFSEPVVRAKARAAALADRYGEDAAREFWVRLQVVWEAKGA